MTQLPTGAQLEKLLRVLQEQAMSDSDHDQEVTEGISRAVSPELWWTLEVNEGAPVLITASTKKHFRDETEAFQEATRLREALVSAAGWKARLNSYVGVSAVESRHSEDGAEAIAGWHGVIRLRLAAND